MTYSHIRVERSGRVGRIVFDRPKILNALGPEMIAQCRDALRVFRESGDVDVAVLTGAGRAFSAGADLAWLAGALEPDERGGDQRHARMEEILHDGHALVRELRDYPGVVVSLVNGPAVGGGVGLALSADIVLAAHSAYFSLPFVPKLGLIPDLGGLTFIQRRIGTARAMGYALLGDMLDAKTAAAQGLIWNAVADETFAKTSDELIARLLALPPSAVAMLKRLASDAEVLPLDGFLDRERQAQSDLFAGPAAAEGVRAVIEKRPADFRPMQPKGK